MNFRIRTAARASSLVFALAAIPAVRAQTSIRTIDGTQPSQNFGWTAVDIGDVDGDGIGDLAIGAVGEGGNAGAVHIHSGATGDWIGSAFGPAGGLHFGEKLAALGDIDFDGIPDFAAAGDGLRGAGGTIARIVAKTVCADPFVWEPYAQGSWSVGQSYTLQIWYRDPGGPCGSNFNMTNAVTILVTP
jgi:hypothetical protein